MKLDIGTQNNSIFTFGSLTSLKDCERIFLKFGREIQGMFFEAW